MNGIREVRLQVLHVQDYDRIRSVAEAGAGRIPKYSLAACYLRSVKSSADDEPLDVFILQSTGSRRFRNSNKE